ncbi:MAG: hypothetical protein R3Y63_03650 [Eubacteriales bacterium]
MSYSALTASQTPPLPLVGHNLGKESLTFIRDNCTDLLHLQEEPNEDYNFNRDIDRLCLETAVARFLETGSRDDAFDVYVCYCEIFQPFGNNYHSVRYLVELLAEHESNSSSLLMKHRDHYTHSVYVFLLGLAIFRNNEKVRLVYEKKYDLVGKGSCHFLEHWGLSSLFHDVGYPFEIAHQQLKVYACVLEGVDKSEVGSQTDFSPFVSYKGMEQFASVTVGEEKIDLRLLLAKEIHKELGETYQLSYEELEETMVYRGNFDNYQEKPKATYLYLDHAYFSGLILAKKYFQSLTNLSQLDQGKVDAIVAVTLHNSLFKFSVNHCHLTKNLDLQDEAPLAYLLMLCDELQCWNRISFGQNSRSDVYPFGFDLKFQDNSIHCIYFYDELYKEQSLKSKSYQSLHTDQPEEMSQFGKSIHDIVDISASLSVTFSTEFKKASRLTAGFMSNTNYLNIYDFALILNGRYENGLKDLHLINTKAKLEELGQKFIASFEKLSLEIKLSNIAQAKGYAKHLQALSCYYTDAPSHKKPLTAFTPAELDKISRLEHERWMEEKFAMGWQYYAKKFDTEKLDKAVRNRNRVHPDLKHFDELSLADQAKDAEPMKLMIPLLALFDGLRIYRIDDTEI